MRLATIRQRPQSWVARISEKEIAALYGAQRYEDNESIRDARTEKSRQRAAGLDGSRPGAALSW